MPIKMRPNRAEMERDRDILREYIAEYYRLVEIGAHQPCPEGLAAMVRRLRRLLAWLEAIP